MKRLGHMCEMSSRAFIAGVLTISLGVAAFSGSAAGAQLPDRAPIPGRYIVVLKDSIDHPGDVARAQTARHNGELRFVYRYALRGYSARLPEQAVDAIARDPRVAYIVPDHPIRAAAQTIPTGTRRTFASSNPYLRINELDDVRANVDVAVLDTGIDISHPDLNVVGRVDCVDVRRVTECTEGSVVAGDHGTHVAGIIGAIDNGQGITGIAPGARLWSVQVLDSDTRDGSFSGYIAGIDWVTGRAGQIEVANSSVGWEEIGYEPVFIQAMENSIEAGVVHVAAAGNEREPVSYPPAEYSDVITVSAIADYDGRPGGLSWFPSLPCAPRGLDDHSYDESNYGFRVDIAAPGVCIYSTVSNGGYDYGTGTSMAAPYVSGAAALLAIHSNPNSRSDVLEIRNRLVLEGNSDWTDDSGDGIKEPLLDVSNPWYFWLETSGQTNPPPEYAPPPTVTTGTVSNLSSTGATLNGTVNPHGASAQYYFEYGPGREYGTRVPVPSGSLPSGIYSDQVVSRAISGLQPNTTYHFRLVASNAGGTTPGADQTFTTAAWTIQTTLNVAGASHSYYFTVGCEPLSTNLCTAVGKSTSSSGVDSPMAQRWDGTSWSFQTPALKSGATHTRLFGVDCPSTTRCIAVGNSQVSGSGSATLAELWNENRWAIQSTPVPANATSSELTDVGCNSTADCVAVGSAVIGNVRTAIAERWRSPTWTLQTVPLPADAASSQLDGVDCLWSNFCVAVGRYNTTGGSTRSLAMFWNGSNWSLQTLAEPAAATETTLLDVSCTASPNACTVVGGWKNLNDENKQFTLAYRFNGSSWTLQSTPNPSGSIASVLQDVSCATPTSCTAAGSWVSGSGGSNQTLAEQWDGSGWSIQGTPNPSGAGFSALFGASCRLTRCIAVGWSRDSAGANRTLGEIR